MMIGIGDTGATLSFIFTVHYSTQTCFMGDAVAARGNRYFKPDISDWYPCKATSASTVINLGCVCTLHFSQRGVKLFTDIWNRFREEVLLLDTNPPLPRNGGTA